MFLNWTARLTLLSFLLLPAVGFSDAVPLEDPEFETAAAAGYHLEKSGKPCAEAAANAEADAADDPIGALINFLTGTGDAKTAE